MKKIFIAAFLFLGLQQTFSQPDTVKMGTFVISVHDINFHDKEYTMRFWLWFLYENQDFDFSKQLDIINAKSFDPPEVITDKMNGKTWAMMKMKATMKENWLVHDFPFDKQHLKVEIENSIYDKGSLVFNPDVKGSVYDKNETIDGWQISNFKVSAGENLYYTGFGDDRPGRDKQTFSQFVIEMDIEREAIGLFMKIFIGMYIAFLIATISFAPKPSELEPRFGLPVGGLFAAVGNKYIIDSLLPETSSFTLVDTLHTITFISIFVTLMISAVSLKYHDNGEDAKAVRFSYIGSRALIASYVLLNAFFIIKAAWQ